MRTLRIAIPAVIALLAGTAAALAGPIAVVNASFETLPIGGINNSCAGTGCGYTSGQGIPGWTTTQQSGQFQPGANTPYFNSIPDGNTVAYAYDGGTISQTVSDVAVAGVLYELQVDLGFRKDSLDPGTVALQVGANTIFATGIASQLSGDWATYTAFFLATGLDTGSAITITLASASQQGDFDNVRLTSSTAVPEPLTFSLFGAGLVGAAALRRRKLRKA